MKKYSLIKSISFLIVPAILLSFVSMPDRVDFSGEWKLNEGKSELGDFGSRFAARSIKVEQKADAITISKTAPSFGGGDATTTETLSFDGKESESTVFGGSKKKSAAQFSEDGQTLFINYTILFERDGQTTQIKGSETWMLTKERSLSLVTVSSSPRGENTTKAMYDK